MFQKDFKNLFQRFYFQSRIAQRVLVVLGAPPFFRLQTFLYLLLFGLLASAQQPGTDPAAAAARQHEERLQQEQIRQQEQIQSRQRDVDIFLQSGIEKSVVEELSDGSCFDVHTIGVEGVTQYPGHKIDALIQSYQQRCLSLNDINRLLKEITTLYIDDGFITSRAFLQPQNLKSGQLTILVVEGTLEALASAEGALEQRQLRWAFPVEIKQLLNLRDLEQGLEHLNRLQQNQAEMDIEPGAQPGESRVLVRNVTAGAFHGGVGINNSGSAATGEWLASAWLSWDNPVRSNDNLYLSISDALDGPDQSKSRSLSLAYSMPYGYGLYSYSASYFEYQQLVQGAAVDFLTRGSSLNHTLNADFTLLRRQRDKVSLSSSITRKQSKNFLEDVFLETSSRVLYLVDLGANYTRPLQRGMLRGSIKWYRSVDWLDATTKLVSAENDFQFDKYTLDVSLNTTLDIFSTPFFYSSSVHLFYSPEIIIASEALSLGSRYTVRGIDEAGLLGYRGGYWRNELTHTYYFTNRGRIDSFVGLDIGASDTPEFPEEGTAWVAGSTVGIRYMHGGFSIDLAYAQALRLPAFIQADQHAVYAGIQLGF